MKKNDFTNQLNMSMTEWNFTRFDNKNPDEIAFLRENDDLFICFAFEYGEWMFSASRLCEGKEHVTYFDYADAKLLLELSSLIWLANEYKINFYEVREDIYDNDSV